jgi:cytochrome c biogenesis protein CcdA
MAVTQLPTLPILVTTALVDSINPCAIGVLVLLISTLLALSDNKKKMFTVGIIYITAVFLTYLLAGLGLLLFLQQFDIARPLGIIVGVIVILLGLVEIKDFFWYGRGFSLTIPSSKVGKIKEYARKATIPGAIVMGMFVAVVELPCTGGPYLAILTVLESMGMNFRVFWYLVLYNLIFVLPLIVILAMVFYGLGVETVKEWKNKKRKWMRLFTGLIMLILGILLIMFANGLININGSI